MAKQRGPDTTCTSRAEKLSISKHTVQYPKQQQQQKRDPNSSSNKTERPTQDTQYAMHAQIICSALFLKSTHGVINMNCLVLNPICNTIDAVPLLYSPFENTLMCCLW